ncbi:MAG TPA: DUF4381 domain-containing protein [Cellvibrio sp.]|nr:DUF4381 domain-containing protein [Cellvibrio sp.]
MQPTQSPLDQLADIHLPDAVSWWPLAPGWWALLALLVVAVIAFAVWRYKNRQNSYRLLAQQQLDIIYKNYQGTGNAAAFLHEISVLLRRVALTAHPTSFNASIKGQAWLDWLDRVCPADKKNQQSLFNSTCGEQLLTASYQKNPAIDATALYHLCGYWLAQHRNHRQKLPATKTVVTIAEAKHV